VELIRASIEHVIVSKKCIDELYSNGCSPVICVHAGLDMRDAELSDATLASTRNVQCIVCNVFANPDRLRCLAFQSPALLVHLIQIRNV
jgi:hypothetical protein